MTRVATRDARKTRATGVRPPYALSAYYASLSIYIGVRQPYWGMWLLSRGLSQPAAGAMATVYLVLESLAGLVSGVLLSRRAARSRVVTAAHASLFAGSLLFLVADGPWPFLILSMITGFAFGALYHAREVFALEHCQTSGFPYGLVRIWGSVAWMLATAGAGFILDRTQFDALVVLILIAIAISLASFGPVRPAHAAGAEPLPLQRASGPSSFAASVKTLRTLPPTYVVVVLLNALIHSSQALFYLFSAVHWKTLGIGSSWVGVYWAVGVASAMIVLVMGHRVVDRWGPWRFMTVAALLSGARWVGMALATHEAAFLALQLLHGFSAAGAPLAAATILMKDIEREALSIAQGGLQLAANLGMALMLLVSGAAYGALGGWAFGIMAAVNVPAIVLGGYMTWRADGRRPSGLRQAADGLGNRSEG